MVRDKRLESRMQFLANLMLASDCAAIVVRDVGGVVNVSAISSRDVLFEDVCSAIGGAVDDQPMQPGEPVRYRRG